MSGVTYGPGSLRGTAPSIASVSVVRCSSPGLARSAVTAATILSRIPEAPRKGLNMIKRMASIIEVVKKLYWFGKILRDYDAGVIIYPSNKSMHFSVATLPEADWGKAEYEKPVQRPQDMRI